MITWQAVRSLAGFEMTRLTTSTTAREESGLGRAAPCTKARHFCTADCDLCLLKPRCCPKDPSRKIPRDIHEHARDVARSLADTEAFEQSRRERKKIEMRFAHLKRILKLGRLRLRGPCGAQDEFVLAAIAQNLRRPRRWSLGAARLRLFALRSVRVAQRASGSGTYPVDPSELAEWHHRSQPIFATKSATSGCRRLTDHRWMPR
jgi:hypothetical protein